MPDSSIIRVWYSGHASEEFLMLTLMHSSACIASAFKKDRISISDISKHQHLKGKLSKSSGMVSKLHGCYTSEFAQLWHKTFGVPSAGVTNKIDFGVVNRPSNIVDIMERIEKSPTSVGNPYWKIFK